REDTARPAPRTPHEPRHLRGSPEDQRSIFEDFFHPNPSETFGGWLDASYVSKVSIQIRSEPQYRGPGQLGKRPYRGEATSAASDADGSAARVRERRASAKYKTRLHSVTDVR